jgi:hypothetical protein
MTVEPMTLEERIQIHRDWVKELGIESLIKQYAEYQVFMSKRCKELRARIEELEQNVQAPEPKYTVGHCANNRVPGGCQLHNLQCGYPDCDRKKIE